MSKGSRGLWGPLSVCLRLTDWRGEKARALRLGVGPQARGRRRPPATTRGHLPVRRDARSHRVVQM